ncbi:MAG: ribose 5-phosphate isomerase B [Planctomycetes bacterium]|jgi:ribose 5-phosphate isomerase B|nr:ribose 5-phosphate isomerase B [Planctomycetota bacterium]
MKVSVGADHAGAEAKDSLVAALRERGHEVVDRGTHGGASVDYPDFAARVAGDVRDGAAQRGILICGTGIGMSMAANKVAGIRAAVCHDEFTVRMSRRHNDANVLCLGARLLAAARIADLAALFLEEPYEGGRHGRRLDKIAALEAGR